MRVAFSNETGVGPRRVEPIAVATAVVMNLDDCWRAVESEMYAIIQETPKHLLHAGKELRGRDLYRALGKDGPKRESAGDVLTRTLMVTRTQAVQICFHVVDRRGYDAFCKNVTADPKLRAKVATSADRAFDGCTRYVERFARSIGEYVLWVSDLSDRHGKKTSKHSWRWLKFLNGSARDPVTYEASSYHPMRIADSIYYSHPSESLALQLADICCSTITLHFLEMFYDWPSAVQPFWELISLGLLGPANPEYRAWSQSATDD